MNVIYARQSVDKKDSLSIEGQVEQCRRYAGDSATVFKDKGYSGKNTKRPAFAELIKAVKDGKVEKIFVYRLDRFSRSIADFSRLWELLERNGVEFYSATENFDTSTPIGRAMLNIVLVFAQLERETIAERVKDNYAHRFRLGAWGGGPAPYGYSLAKITDDGRKVSSLVKNENAGTVEEIFRKYADTAVSLRALASELTARGIPGPKREIWDSVTLSRILHSPVYVMANADVYWYFAAKGMRMCQSPDAFDGLHACNIMRRRDRSIGRYSAPENQMLTVTNYEGIVNSELWLAVQEKLSGNNQLPRINAGKYSWLTGLMKCGRCGYAVKVNYNKKEKKTKLVCSGRSNLSVCDAVIDVDLREIEDCTADEIEKMLCGAPPVGVPPDASRRASEILSVDKKIERLVSALAQCSDVSVSYISGEIEKLHKLREELSAQHGKKSAELASLDFKSLDFDEKKIVASEFINKILINENEVNIEWKM